MGSFYGQVSLGGSGSGGVSDYNELSNKPIKNLTGLTAINLSLLEEGLYNVKGNYIYNSSDTAVKTFASPRLLQVLLDDSVTDAKNIIFNFYNFAVLGNIKVKISIVFDKATRCFGFIQKITVIR